MQNRTLHSKISSSLCLVKIYNIEVIDFVQLVVACSNELPSNFLVNVVLLLKMSHTLKSAYYLLAPTYNQHLFMCFQEGFIKKHTVCTLMILLTTVNGPSLVEDNDIWSYEGYNDNIIWHAHIGLPILLLNKRIQKCYCSY